MAYRIITDATCDMDREMLKGLPDLTILPMDVFIGEEVFVHGPGGNLTTEAFYRRLHEGAFASTSQIPPLRFEEAFRSVLEKGDDLLCLGFTSGLSGTCQNAVSAKRTLEKQYPGRDIRVVDTLCASAGLGFLVHETLKRQAMGASLDEAEDFALRYRLLVCHYFTVDAFDHLRHGGRVSGAAAAIGTVLNIKPLLRVDDDGRLEVVGKPRGTKQAMQVMLTRMEETRDFKVSPYVVVAHGDNKAGAAELKKRVSERFPEAEIQTTKIGPVVGSHTGPGMLAVLFWGSHR